MLTLPQNHNLKTDAELGDREKMKYYIAFYILTLSCFSFSEQTMVFSFPDSVLKTEEGRRFTSFVLVIPCGEVRSIGHIPTDWNIRVVRPISGVAFFEAETGHGASQLDNLAPFNKKIVIAISEKGCFSLRANIVTDYENNLVFEGKQLGVNPFPVQEENTVFQIP